MVFPDYMITGTHIFSSDITLHYIPYKVWPNKFLVAYTIKSSNIPVGKQNKHSLTLRIELFWLQCIATIWH